MNRKLMLQQLSSVTQWDICIIGGGATGLGIAVDAASRGYKTILFEKHDFAKGTSSRSTKLVHGGVRYLQQGNIRLVIDALKERGLLLKNAPHLVHNQSFVIPNYKWWENTFYGIGLKVYDWMAGSLGLGPSEFLSIDETLKLAPTLDPHGLRGGVLYHDGQFDDARLAIHLAMTAADNDATLVNYMGVTGLLKQNNKTIGVKVKDHASGDEFEIQSKAVINATGIFTDEILALDTPGSPKLVSPSQGIHIVLDRNFLPGDTAIMIPRTDDKRVLFAVPWHNRIIVGTTDTPVGQISEEPVPFDAEIDFVLKHIGRYLTKQPTRDDVLSQFAGLRPLVKGAAKNTASLSRDHLITVSDSELITITGGKWTTYRKMAEDVIEIAVTKAGLPEKACKTMDLPLHGFTNQLPEIFSVYGSDANEIIKFIKNDPTLNEKIHPSLQTTFAEIKWAVENEMCMTVEDFLSRRTRNLLLDARASIAASTIVAQKIAAFSGQDDQWIQNQVKEFTSLAKNYIPR